MPDEFDTLEDKIKAARGGKNGDGKPSKESENMNIGMRAGSELVGAIIVSTLIGIGLDKWLGTGPIFLIILLLLGVATGFYNIYRLTQK